MKLSCKKQALKYFAVSVFLALFGSAAIAPLAQAQAEIDPDHFDSPGMESIPQSRPAADKVTGTQYDRSFSLPYSVLCNGRKLAPGKYSISLRSDGKVGQATLNQKGHAIEIAPVVETRTSKRGDEIVVESRKDGRTLSVVRVGGRDFVFDPKRGTDPLAHSGTTIEQNLPLTVIATHEIAGASRMDR